MLDKILRFFIEHARINYTLFILIFAIGVWSYIKTPKEIFPSFSLNIISISGGYAGTSVDVLDKLAVAEIEDIIKNSDAIDTMTTFISPGSFNIIVELNNGFDKYEEANDFKDAIAQVKTNLPSDMDEPTVRTLNKSRSITGISIMSDTLSVDELKPLAEELKSDIFKVKGISEVEIFGDSDLFFEVILDEKKIDALKLNKNEVFNIVSQLSYIFPIGKIEDPKKHFFVSTQNGAKTKDEFENTLIRVSNKSLYIKDIATISKKYEDASTLASSNGRASLKLSVQQLETANAIEVVEAIKNVLPKYQVKHPNIELQLVDDDSQRIKDRLNIVISNILLGIILIAVLVTWLINARMSIIIAIGIPTSFVLASAYFYFLGYSINMISLVGVLIAIGIVVDDAIVVSENIQQYIEQGYKPKEAALKGASEMVKPVTIASATTLFSFLPILLIDGTIGEVIKLIPIALSSLIIASLIESFLFLPIHAAHTLKNDSKVTSWDRANKIYNKMIHFFISWKKSFITIFIILVPIITVYLFTISKFQFFPKFNANSINITLKAKSSTTLEDSFKIVNSIEKDLIKYKDELYIYSIDSVAGFRRDVGNNTERFPYSMYMTIELQKEKPSNFVDKYITPYLSFYYNKEGRVRDISSDIVASKIDKYLKEADYKTKFDLEEIEILEKKVGPIRSDIQIGVITPNNQLAIKSIMLLDSELNKIKGIKSSANSLKFGIDEIKIKVNSYGATLGITEQFIGSYLANLYLLKKSGVSFDEEKLIEIKVESNVKNSFEELKKSVIPLENGTFVILEDVVELNVIRAFEQLIKDNGIKNFYVYANVDPDIITSAEVLKQLQPTIEKIEKDGVELSFKGEAEETNEFIQNMLLATVLALILITIAMLYLFNSFKDTLIVMSVIPFSILGVLVGHIMMGQNLSMSSVIGTLGLAGVVINDGIIMMTYLKKAKNIDEIFTRATKRLRPIIITTVTTIVGMATLMFFPSGEAAIFQPIAIALGFGLAWGTILNLIYLPTLYTLTHKLRGSQ